MNDSLSTRTFPDPIPMLGGLCAIGFILFLAAPERTATPYFFSAGTFLYPVFILSGLAFLFTRLGKPGASLVTAAVGTTFFAYGCLEVVFSHLPNPGPWLSATSPWAPLWKELHSYAGNRGLQLFPIFLLAGLLAFHLRQQWRHRIRIGNSDATTTALGGTEPQTWKRVAARIAFFITVATVGFLAAKGAGTGGSDRLMIFSGRLVGGATNSLMEELLFRGVLQPVFEIALSTTAANILQAVFFSVIHYGFVESLTWNALAPEMIKLVLYTGIGLFLGRAAQETNGLLIPWFFHFLITSAIWVLLTVQGT